MANNHKDLGRLKAAGAAGYACSPHPYFNSGWVTEFAAYAAKNKAAERRAQVSLLNDLFGNPFRPVAVDPAWLTSTVVALAKGMYESRDFSAMPILADALQDAGCDSDEVLDHCRGPGPHVRGCWVLDSLLGLN